MEETIATVRTVEITKAVRRTQLNGLKIKRGQFIAILNDEELIAKGNKTPGLIFEALVRADIEGAEMVTIYYGAETQTTEAEEIAQEIRNRYQTEVEVVHGGQPHYDYIISLE